MSKLQTDFENAVENVRKLSRRPSDNELLELYALFKQGTSGDVSGKRPGMLDFKGRAKHDAWAAKKGTSKDGAMTSYIELVEKLRGTHG